MPFIKSEAPIKVLCGGNRTSKTSCGCALLVGIANGENPWTGKKYKTPNTTWAVALDHENLGSVLRQRLREMLPAGFKERSQPPVFTLPNGSKIVVKSADPSSGMEKFQGEGIQAALFDEEPVGENGRQIFHETYARRMPGVQLEIMLTFTPLQGFSWSYRELWNPETRTFPGVECFVVTQMDASKSHGGFWTDAELDDFKAGYSEAEWEARVLGKYGQLSGSTYFSGKLLEEAAQKCEKGDRYKVRFSPAHGPVVEPDSRGPLTIFRPPCSGHKYIVGVDPAGGIGRDSSVATVFDREDNAFVAVWSSNRVDAHEFGANAVLPLGIHYNNALIVVESNNEHGGTVLNELRNRYHHVYRNRRWNAVRREYQSEYGFKTTAANRMSIYDALSKTLREGLWTPYKELLDEMATTVMKENEKVEHMDGCHDDHVFSAGLALVVHLDSPMYAVKYEKMPSYAGQENAWMGAA
jgi:phage terminase large subunit-like protein